MLPHPSVPEWQHLTTQGREVLHTHGRITALIRGQLGEEAAGFLAIPVLDEANRLTGWRSAHGGVLLPLSQSEDPAGVLAQADAVRRQILELANRLDEQGDTGVVAAHTLRSALITPEGMEAVHVDGSHPVLVFWGMALSGQDRPRLILPRRDTPSRRATVHPIWAVPALLAMIALVQLWFVLFQRPAIDPGRLDRLDAALAEVTGALPRFTAACRADCSTAVAQAPEVVLVLDASSSMGYSVNTPPEMEQQMFAFIKRDRIPEFNRLEDEARALPGPSRMAVARQMLHLAVSRLPERADIQVLSFHDCNDVRRAGRFSPMQSGALSSALDAIKPTNATDLARAIRQAADLTRGARTADTPVSMIIVSDGLDSCGGDPCAAARAAKRLRPGLTISVIDLSAFQRLACVAAETGGFYAQARDYDDPAALATLIGRTSGGSCTDRDG